MKKIVLCLIMLAGCNQSSNYGVSGDSKQYDSLDEQRAYNRIRQEGVDDASAQRSVIIAKEMVERDRQLRNSR